MIIVLTKKDLLPTARNKDMEDIRVEDTILRFDHVHQADLIIFVSSLVAKTLKDRTADIKKIISVPDAMRRIEEMTEADYEFATWED
jgi:hypothetical protein